MWVITLQKATVLAPAATELIFFIVVIMGLYFSFVLAITLIIQECFSCCWAVLAQSLSPQQWAGWGYRKLGGDTSGTADPSWSQGCSTPRGVMLTNKARGKISRGYCWRTGWASPHWWAIVFICITLSCVLFLSLHVSMSSFPSLPFFFLRDSSDRDCSDGVWEAGSTLSAAWDRRSTIPWGDQ